MTDVVVTFWFETNGYFLADVVCHMIVMADVYCHCGRCKCHFVSMWKFKTTLNDVFIDCGRCYNHNMNWLMLLPWWYMELPHLNGLMFLPNAADGTATYVTADKFVCCGRWNGHYVTG